MPGLSAKPLGLLTLLAALALLAGASANADSSRITRGDAHAVFEAASTGGGAIDLHGGRVTGPHQRDPEDGVRINAFAPWDGIHYCALDWHVISINLVDGNFPGETRKRTEIAAALSAVAVTWILDGATARSVTNPCQARAVDAEARFGLVEGFYFTAGLVMAPDDLAAGQHTLRIMVTDPSGLVADSQITFFVDDVGTGACL